MLANPLKFFLVLIFLLVLFKQSSNSLTTYPKQTQMFPLESILCLISSTPAVFTSTHQFLLVLFNNEQNLHKFDTKHQTFVPGIALRPRSPGKFLPPTSKNCGGEEEISEVKYSFICYYQYNQYIKDQYFRGHSLTPSL